MRGAELRSLPRPSRLATPISSLKGAGPKLTAAAAAIGIETLEDLLWHVPHGHRDRAGVREVADLRIGEEATVMVSVRSARVRPTRRRNLRLVEAAVSDSSGPMKAVWFNQAYLAERLQPGTRLLLNGKLDRSGFRVATHEIVAGGGPAPAKAGLHTTGIVPVHNATRELSANRLREWIWQAVGRAGDAIESLPAELRVRRRLASQSDALRCAHFPDSPEQGTMARDRLAFEELCLHQAALAMRRGARRDARPGIAFEPAGELVAGWLDSLPFEPTAGQLGAFDEIDADLAAGRPMQRLLMGEVGSGKAQPLDALVLTPCGFRTMGSLEVGDAVTAPDGTAAEVAGVFPQGVRDVWRVSFSDGTSAECDADHLWEVQTSSARWRGDARKVMTLREIAADMLRPSGSPKWHVELPVAADLDGAGPRPLDPYLLGLLLGDGGLSIPDRVRFSSADGELVEAVRQLIPDGCRLRREATRQYDWLVMGARLAVDKAALRRARRGDRVSLAAAYDGGASCEMIGERIGLGPGTVRYHLLRHGVRMRTPHRSINVVRQALDSLGLMGKRSAAKSVPRPYLVAPVIDRHALLQGLLDTDGTLDAKSGSNVSFTSASRQLAEDVAWLVRSLGGRARCRSVTKAGGEYWTTSVALPNEYPPFRLRRKARLVRPRTKYAHPAKGIVAVEPVGRKRVQCIAITHPSQLYITDGFTITHNTVVAVYAMLRALEAGRQAAMMAPTETLAEQHAATLDALLAPIEGMALPYALLTGATPPARRRETLGRLASGELGLVVGTHALIEPDVRFGGLAVCIVDEQHRFGVRQRAALDAKGPGEAAPHVLHMTATPIPRTLSLTAYGDLDATTIRELPAGRRPVKTWVVGEEKRAGAYEFIRERLREGRQAYVVCPLVADSEKLRAKAAGAEAERLRAGELADFRIGLLHGQMSSREKAEAMDEFVAGRTDVLVATTVIEVGIDVSNATVMLIEGAERFGLSQLHQLRGRVGRGEHESQCILFADLEGQFAKRRMEAIEGSSDGFELAEVDLVLRGEGEILGTLQHGLPRYRVAELPEDAELLAAARAEVLALLERYGSLDVPDLGPLLDAARARFGDERVEGIAA
ncbi:MAG: helicase-related protein [Vicinamibacteria bacterium]